MTGARGPGHRYRGVVSEFDAGLGLGTIEDSDGNAYPFHCLAIVDGSREIEVGLDVGFEVLPKLGRYEACRIGP